MNIANCLDYQHKHDLTLDQIELEYYQPNLFTKFLCVHAYIYIYIYI